MFFYSFFIPCTLNMTCISERHHCHHRCQQDEKHGNDLESLRGLRRQRRVDMDQVVGTKRDAYYSVVVFFSGFTLPFRLLKLILGLSLKELSLHLILTFSLFLPHSFT